MPASTPAISSGTYWPCQLDTLALVESSRKAAMSLRMASAVAPTVGSRSPVWRWPE